MSGFNGKHSDGMRQDGKEGDRQRSEVTEQSGAMQMRKAGMR